MELAIYQYVDAYGQARTVSIPDLNQILGGSTSFSLIIDRLKDLYGQGRINLYKYGGGSTKIPYDKFVVIEGETNFFGNGFVIETAPQGRKYFQELEARSKREQESNVIFISCGQVSKEERALGKAIEAAVEQHCSPFRGYFAESQNSLESLSRHIFASLDQCAGFVAVMHHRGEVRTPDGTHTRASVWIEQEIAIAAFLTQVYGKKFPIAFYIQKGIKREGVREQLRIDAVEFENESEVLADFRARLTNGKFTPRLPE